MQNSNCDELLPQTEKHPCYFPARVLVGVHLLRSMHRALNLIGGRVGCAPVRGGGDAAQMRESPWDAGPSPAGVIANVRGRDADWILDFLGVAHVFIRRPHPRGQAVHQTGAASSGGHPIAWLLNQECS